MVIDTNVLVSLTLNPNDSNREFVQYNNFFAPGFLKYEFINVLRKYHFLQGLPKTDVLDIYNSGLDLITEFFDNDIIYEKAIEYSFQLNHPIYDCFFLAAAHQFNLPFVSKDKKLLQKAKQLNIEVFEFLEK